MKQDPNASIRQLGYTSSHGRSSYIREHKQEILEDMLLLKRPAMMKKWHIGTGTYAKLLRSAKIPQPKQTSALPPPEPQDYPDDIGARVLDALLARIEEGQTAQREYAQLEVLAKQIGNDLREALKQNAALKEALKKADEEAARVTRAHNNYIEEQKERLRKTINVRS